MLSPAPRRLELLLLTLAFTLLAGAGVTLLAQPAVPADAKLSPRDVELLWQRNWKNYARRCIKLGDVFYSCAAYETQYPSSRGITTIALRQKTSREISDRKGLNITVKRSLIKPNEEIDLGAKSLPELAVGHYGHIHSAEILDVLGPAEMVIAGIWLVDPKEVAAQRQSERDKLVARNVTRTDLTTILDWMFEYRDQQLKQQSDRSFRTPIKLRGISTAGLAKGDRWTGKEGSPQIALVGEEVGEQKSKFRKPESILLAVPADLFMRSISDEKEFLAYLTARGFTKETFVELIVSEKKINPANDRLADAFIFSKLDGRGQEKEVPKQ